ncbi:unnamed protein product [Acanthoscelides obtectus]|uniref:Uncharacterized protein n=1 Tax=Acanthoscelides obtectus TaxID=200917 RepID=A0A9P0PF79_ACAOB|nr:unnamed protein product [Acanthoscelides obtectus]CAK1635876.1 hypothetical protein AOBTE_LOCUS9583 [Acanthoscelides obtectus]
MMFIAEKVQAFPEILEKSQVPAMKKKKTATLTDIVKEYCADFHSYNTSHCNNLVLPTNRLARTNSEEIKLYNALPDESFSELPIISVRMQVVKICTLFCSHCHQCKVPHLFVVPKMFFSSIQLVNRCLKWKKNMWRDIEAMHV